MGIPLLIPPGPVPPTRCKISRIDSVSCHEGAGSGRDHHHRAPVKSHETLRRLVQSDCLCGRHIGTGTESAASVEGTTMTTQTTCAACQTMPRRARGAGTLYARPERGDHAFQYRDASGARKTGTAKTHALAERALNAATTDRDRGIRPTTRRHTVASWVDVWIEQLPAGRLRPQSERRYRTALASWKTDPIGRVKLADLGPEHFGATLARWRSAGVPASGQVVRLKVLRTALDAAMVARHLAVNYARAPWTPLPRVEHAPIDPPGGSDLERLRARIAGDPLEAVWMLGLDVGLRQGEILALKARDLETGPDGSWITVRGTIVYGTEIVGPPKSRQGHRRLPIPQTVAAAIDRYVKTRYDGMALHPDAFIFQRAAGGPMWGQRILVGWHALCDAAGVKRYRFHDLRHAFVTDALARGIDMTVVSRYVGHSSIDMTVDRYGHLSIGAVR